MDLNVKVLNGAFISAFAKLLSKVIGVVSTLVLARLLSPEEFGLIAIVSISLYFFDILSNSASEQYIIQKTSVSRGDLNSAWTLNLALKCLCCFCFISASHFISLFFERPELKTAFIVSSLILILNSLKSPSFVLLRRQLRFAVLFRLTLIERILVFPILIVLAFYLRSFWAFIVTDLIASCIAVLLSYYVIKRPPSFSLVGVSRQWYFSKWMLIKNVVGYVRAQIDTILVSKVFAPSLLGNYHMAREISMMPAHFFLAPALEPLLSAFRRNKKELIKLKKDLAFTVHVVFLFTIPLLIYISEFANKVIFVLLGDGWNIAADILPILSLLFFYWPLMLVIEDYFIVREKVKVVLIIDLIALLLIAITLIVCYLSSENIANFAWGRGVAGLGVALTILIIVLRDSFHELLRIFATTLCQVFASFAAINLSKAVLAFVYRWDTTNLGEYMLLFTLETLLFFLLYFLTVSAGYVFLPFQFGVRLRKMVIQTFKEFKG